MKSSDVFPNSMAEAVYVDFTFTGRECVKENLTQLHPRKVGNMKKETVGAIAKHFHERKIGRFNG